jgi:hypothetical protein
MMRGAWLLAVAMILAWSERAGEFSLQNLGRFLSKHYCADRPLLNQEISFTAPLTGEQTTFLHFTWRVTSRDQYGRSKGDDLFGVVKYDTNGLLDQLVVGGPRVSEKRLAELRALIKTSRGWPARASGIAFGPNSDVDQIRELASGPISELLEVPVHSETVRFRITNAGGEPDATWHVQLRAVDAGERVWVKARIEPFTGKIIQLDVCREDGC